MAERAAAGQPTLSGMVTEGEVIYASSSGAPQTDREPVALFVGEVLGGAVQDLPDTAIEAQLEALARRLSARLKQEHVTIAYRDHSWILDLTAPSPPSAAC
jgi:hypothetical protein